MTQYQKAKIKWFIENIEYFTIANTYYDVKKDKNTITHNCSIRIFSDGSRRYKNIGDDEFIKTIFKNSQNLSPKKTAILYFNIRHFVLFENNNLKKIDFYANRKIKIKDTFKSKRKKETIEEKKLKKLMEILS